MEGGPKLGVVVDFDERLPKLLENLEMAHYFDVVVSSRCVLEYELCVRTGCHPFSVSYPRDTSLPSRNNREAGACKPDPTPFKLAMEKAGVKNPSRVMHLGTDFDKVGSRVYGYAYT